MSSEIPEKVSLETASTLPEASSSSSLEQQPQQPQQQAMEVSEETLSKSQMKKRKRRQQWEEERENRKVARKEKRVQQRERRREGFREAVQRTLAEHDHNISEEEATRMVLDAAKAAEDTSILPVGVAQKKKKQQRAQGQRVPISLIIDCDFERYMHEKELLSISAQVTRCYSENRRARYVSHMYISSLKGKLLERFDTVMNGHYKQWKMVKTVPCDFMEAARLALEEMKVEKEAGQENLITTLQTGEEKPMVDANKDDASLATRPSTETEPTVCAETKELSKETVLEVDQRSDITPAIRPEPGTGLPLMEDGVTHPEIVYLTSDSPYLLERLEPHTCYVIGGIVDRNREKGLCYRLAKERGVRTAKLPIGEYMVMQSRKVLATNHVVEIMLKWLEAGDWGKAFLEVIPKRKGGKLKDDEDEGEGEEDEGEENGDVEAEMEEGDIEGEDEADEVKSGKEDSKKQDE